MYIHTGRRTRRPMYGLGWTGGFTLPGSTTRYSTETCTGSAAQPMTGGSMICGMDNETAYLTGIGCTAVGFRGQNSCATDAGNAGALFCCPPAALQQALARQGSTPGVTPLTPDSPIGARLGITTTQIVALAGLAAVIGIFGYFLTKKEPGYESGLPELTPEQERWADESGAAFGEDLREYRRKYGLGD